MKNLIILAVFIFLGFNAQAQANFKFTKTTHNFGKVNAGNDTLWVNFEFVNDGTEVLLISDVKTSCDCTLADYPKNGIPPGGKGVIKGGFKIEGKAGPFKKNIIIMGNTMPGTTFLTMEGEIITN